MADEAGTWRVVFASNREAERYLAERGFSLGRMQGPSERGILLGDFDIQKWRNLSAFDRAALHGVMTRFLDGRAAITIFGAAPEEAHRAIRSVGAQPRSGEASASQTDPPV